MKINLRSITAALLIYFVATNAAYAQTTNVSLNTGWEFHEFNGNKKQLAEWHTATVPGLVHTDLLAHQLIPDPFYRDNEKQVQWVENTEWEYRKSVNATQALLQHQHIELVFKGLNTLADVYLNSHLLLKADNMFREWRIDVKPYLKPGDNKLSIVFHRLKPEIARLKKVHPEEQDGADTTNEIAKAFTEKLIQGSYVRKAAYEGGWDWGPSLVTCGVWQPVYLQTWEDAKISDLGIIQTDITQQAANINVQIEVMAAAKSSAVLKIAYGKNKVNIQQINYPVSLHKGINIINYPVNIASPELWYPHGYGAQPKYHFSATLVSAGRAADSRTVQTGLRSVKLNTAKDSSGRKFEFIVNGIPVFAKGANIIPFDHFPTRVTTQRYKHYLDAVINANMNMVRLWGGGYYENEAFYNLCDDLGIMVWQDFMFANATPPAFLRDNVEKEVEYQVRRLRNHPSIAVWGGNNEISMNVEPSVAVIPDMFKPLMEKMKPSSPKIYTNYAMTFYGLVPNIVKELSPEASYTPSSPTANFEKQTATYTSGDRHNYEVWWNNKSIEEQAGYKDRFVSETGIQGFPDVATINEFTMPEDRTVTSPVMNSHQKNFVVNGNTVIAKIVKTEFHEPADFASFVYLSQLTQAESLKIYAEAMRRRKPFSMGFLFWQLNDTWPVISWAGIDYNSRPKAAMYYARRFFSPVLVSPVDIGNAVNVFVVSDLTVDQPVSIEWKLMDLSGKILKSDKMSYTAKALSSAVALTLPKEELNAAGYNADHSFLSFKVIRNNSEVLSANNLYFQKPKDLHFPEAAILSDLSVKGDHYVLKLSCPVLASKVDVSFGMEAAQLSDNYVDIIPGEPEYITVKSAASLEQLKKALTLKSINKIK